MRTVPCTALLAATAVSIVCCTVAKAAFPPKKAMPFANARNSLGGVSAAMSAGQERSYNRSLTANFSDGAQRGLPLFSATQIPHPASLLLDIFKSNSKQGILSDVLRKFATLYFPHLEKAIPPDKNLRDDVMIDGKPLNVALAYMLNAFILKSAGYQIISPNGAQMDKADWSIDDLKTYAEDKDVDAEDLLIVEELWHHNFPQEQKDNDEVVLAVRHLLAKVYELSPSPFDTRINKQNLKLPINILHPNLNDPNLILAEDIVHEWRKDAIAYSAAKSPSKELLYVDIQDRVAHGYQVFAPGLLYSNLHSGFDAGYQAIAGKVRGSAYGLRFDLVDTNRRFSKVIDNINNAINVDLRNMRDKSNLISDPGALLVLDEDADTAEDQYTKALLSPTLAGIIGYSSIGGLGQLTDAGFSASYLRPLGSKRPSPGLLALVSTEGLWLAQSGHSIQPGVRFGYALVFQDDVPYFDRSAYDVTNDYNDASYDYKHGGHNVQYQRLRSWNWQVGFASTLNNPIDGGDSWAVFVRVKKDADTIFTLSGGQGSDHKDFVEFSIGKGFHF